MYYGNIEKHDAINGPGIRTLLFVSGCTHKCKGCHNKDSWDFKYGKPFTDDESRLILSHLSSPVVQGFSLLGGEPFDNLGECVKLLKQIKSIYPEKDIWVWSGYTYEQIISDPDKKHMLQYCDVLVDGRYVDKLRDLTLSFRGSSNQRIINIQESLTSGNIVFNRFYKK